MRVIVRNAAKLPQDFVGKDDVIEGRHDDESVLMQALKGAETFFLVIPPSFATKDEFEHAMSFTRPVCKAIKAQGVKRVVSVSGICHSLDPKAGTVTAPYVKDMEIEKLGIAHRALWCPGFMDNMVMHIEALKHQSAFFLPSRPDKKLPFVATRDIAKSAAKLLLDRSWSGPGGLAVLGPEDLTWLEVADSLTDVLGKPIRYQQIAGGAYKAQLVSHGASSEFADALLEMFAAKDNGLDDEPRNKENTTETTFREWATEFFLPAINQ